MQYTLGRDAVTQPFEVKLVLNTRVDCGIYHFEFIDEHGKPLNPAYFSAPTLSTEETIFKILQQNDLSSVKEYNIRYRASLLEYP